MIHLLHLMQSKPHPPYIYIIENGILSTLYTTIPSNPVTSVTSVTYKERRSLVW